MKQLNEEFKKERRDRLLEQFEIKTNTDDTVYLYCINVEIRKFTDIVRGIFATVHY